MSSKRRKINNRLSETEIDAWFNQIKSLYKTRRTFDQLNKNELKQLDEKFKELSSSKSRFSEEKYEINREQEWKKIRDVLQWGIDFGSNNPDSELFKTAKELLDIIDLAEEEPLSISKYQDKKFCTGLDRYKALIKAKCRRNIGKQEERLKKNKKTEKGHGNFKAQKLPKHAITLKVAASEFNVSRSTLMRAIHDGRLKSYRPEKCSQSAPHFVDAVEVAQHWPLTKKA